MSNLEIPILQSNDEIPIPRYAYAGDAGVDLRSTESFVLKPMERKLVSTGISLEIPDGYAGLVMPRSGLAIKHGISIVNAPGLIDSNYRGEIKVPLINLDQNENFEVAVGDRIAQLVIIKVPEVDFIKVNELSETNRGARGFGSSGVTLDK
ncbi:MAG: dUTP diphosphatase [Eggerthellaceae bacterium]|jgi:dUTP pyrophosphatase